MDGANVTLKSNKTIKTAKLKCTQTRHVTNQSLFRPSDHSPTLMTASKIEKRILLNKVSKQRCQEWKSPSWKKWAVFQFLLCGSFAAGCRTHPLRHFAFDFCRRLLRLLRVPTGTGLWLWSLLRLWRLHASRLPESEVRLSEVGLMLCSSSSSWLVWRACGLLWWCRRSDTALHCPHRLQPRQHRRQLSVTL